MELWKEYPRAFVRYLCERYEISPSQVMFGREADVLLWTSPEALKQGHTPWMIFEIKLNITTRLQSVLRRTADIALRAGARHLGIVARDMELYYSLEPMENGWRLEERMHFPRWEGLRDKNPDARFNIPNASPDGKAPAFPRIEEYVPFKHVPPITIPNVQILSTCYKLLYAREHLAQESNLGELCKILLMRAAWARETGSPPTTEEFHSRGEGADLLRESETNLQTLYHVAAKHFPEELDGAGSPKISLETFNAVLRYMRALPLEPEKALSDFLDTSFQDIVPDDLYSTPKAIIQFAVRMLEPRPGQIVCDPVCGRGSFLYHAARHVSESRNAQDAPLKVLGMDYSNDVVRVARTRFAFREKGAEKVNLLALDPLLSFSPPCDIVFANPPVFKYSRGADRFKLYRLSPRSDILFLEYALQILKEGGRMGIFLSEDVLIARDSVHQKIREFVERQAEIQLVCRLPAAVRTGRFLLFLRKRKPSEPRTEVRFPVAFFPDGKLTEENLSFDKFKAAYEDYRATGRAERENGFSLYPLNSTRLRVWFSPPSPFDSKYLMQPLFTLAARPKLRKLPDESLWHSMGVQNGEIVAKETVVAAETIGSGRVAKPGQIAVVTMGSVLGRARVVQSPDTPDVPRQQQIAGCLESRNVQLLEVTDPNVEPEYVAVILNLDKFRNLAEGAANPHINFSRLLQERIPVPPKDVQESVIRCMRDARREAVKLRAQAEQCLQQADAIQKEAQTEILALF